jgi:hypothetical protein
MDSSLLNYAFSTAPIPLQVNQLDTQATSRINLGVSNPTPGVLCSEITVAIPVGDGPTDFCREVPSSSVNTGKWSITSQEVVKGEEIGLPGGLYATITFDCRDQADYGLGYSLVLSVVGVVNSATGDFPYMIRELSGTSLDNMTLKTSTATLSKQDAIFTLANFVATASDKPTVPGTSFKNGQPLRLSWESTGTWFEVYAKGSPAPLYAGPKTSYSLDAGLAADAQFVLVASVAGDPSQDSPSPGYQPIFLYDALTLVVSNPDLTPKTVSAEGRVATATELAGGTLTIVGQAKVGPLTAASATVTGHTTARGGLAVGTDSAPAAADVHGTLGVSGQATAGSLTVTHAANVGGGLTVTGASTVNGNLTVTQAAAMDQASAQRLDAKTINADSIVVSGPGTSLFVEGDGQLWVRNFGDRNGAQVFNNSARYPTGWFENRAGRSGNVVTGLVGWVAQTSDIGLYTNGRSVLASGTAALTHLPTRHGHRVVTSPLVTQAELHISGSAQLSNGRARVAFDEDIADLVLFLDDTPYKVLVTPTGRCAGLIVVEKAARYFIVEEAADGYSDASFDWIVITRQRAEGEVSIAMELPTVLPAPERFPDSESEA